MTREDSLAIVAPEGRPARAWTWGLLLVAGCAGAEGTPRLFEPLPPGRTGVTFVNELTDTPELSIVNYLNFYNGGGVAVGDVDGDGLSDLFFTSNLGTDRLYRNLGDFTFEDVTETAGVGDAAGWTSGATMADVNGDGHLDIYVSTVTHLTVRGGNVLYVNNGDGTFTDRTSQYGLEHVGYSTQAAFVDYDVDGDLDMYLLNHSTHDERGRVWNPQRATRHPTAGDRLFRNDGDRFVDVSQAAGIYGGVEGYGLGVVASDLNLDGCPDLFVANDFHESDFLYVNNCDGTFTESIATATGHTSHSSMGVDAADFDNDGRPDIIVLDMLPEREDVLKSSATVEDLAVFRMKAENRYHPQFARNTLQWNRGGGRFSDVGYLAGVHATDWSWAALFADLDNDGDKDLFVTNGIYRRPNDLDYITYVGTRPVQEALQDGVDDDLLASLLERMPQVPIPNYAFRNDGDLTFTNAAEQWGVSEPGFSTGAAYVDLDRDGALDLVVNNINAPAGVYRNRARELTDHHYLAVRLTGDGANTHGVGAKVVIGHDGVTQIVEQMPTRGFQSSVDPRLHFGLASAGSIDSLLVIWPDRRFQVLRDVAVDQVVTLSQDAAESRYDYAAFSGGEPLFDDITEEWSVAYTHAENRFFDSTREPLIPHRLSTEGPALAVGDVNGDGLDDVYVGGAKWQAGRLLVQRRDGTFADGSAAVFARDSLAEDVDAIFFDADGNGYDDLYVVSGGNEFWGEQEPLRDRLYLNDGRGNMRRSDAGLPVFHENGSHVAAADFNGDGSVDLFVGGRVVSRRYGATPRSYLLQGDGAGGFSDVTADVAPELSEAGMVTGAEWMDYDADGRLDLIVVGEWMPIRVFHQEERRLVDRTAEAGLGETNGWWNDVTVTDLQGDGLPDLVVGNLGLNSYVRASRAEPARMYVYDFANNGTAEQILTFYKNGVSYPMAGRDELLRTVPQLRGRFPSYADFGASGVEDIFPAAELSNAEVREAVLLASVIGLNNGDGTFEIRALPREAQSAPLYATLSGDFDADGHTDLVVAGNFHGVPPMRGQYDASHGLLLRGDGSGRLDPVGFAASNLRILGQVRDLALVRLADGGRAIVAARNGDGLRVIRVLGPGDARP